MVTRYYKINVRAMTCNGHLRLTLLFSRCVSFLILISFSFNLNLSEFLHAAKLHSAFLCLAVIYACDFTAAKKLNRIAIQELSLIHI